MTLGPEVFHAKRIRKGGSEQSGYLYGGYGSYERIRRNAIYWGVDGYYAQGTLNGHNGEDKLKSRIKEYEIEARLGYTWNPKCLCRKLWLTPLVSWGYFEEKNQFINPSPVEVDFKTRFHFAGIGFLSRYCVTERWSVGVNFFAKHMFGARCLVTDHSGFGGPVGDDDDDDEEFDELLEDLEDGDTEDLVVEDKFLYQLELPITYKLCCGRYPPLELSVVPFFRYRHYGGHQNYPHDFIDTRFRIFGTRFLISASF